MTRWSTIVVAGCGLLAGVIPHLTQAQEAAGISGTWVLNHDESDDVQQRLSELRGGRAGVVPGGIGGTPPGGIQGGGQTDPEQMRHVRQRILHMGQQLAVFQDGAQVTLIGRDATPLVLYTDGEPSTQMIQGLGEVEFTAEWKGEELRVRRTGADGSEIEQRYRLIDDERRLRVSTAVRMRGGGPSMEFNLVYDRRSEDP